MQNERYTYCSVQLRYKMKERVSQLTTVLDVSISRDYHLSIYIWFKLHIITSLDESIAYLEAFKHLVSCSGY